jgi:hypothetical protein
MPMGIKQQEEITLGYFVKVISVLPISTAAHVQWRSAVTVSGKTQMILSPALLESRWQEL